MCEPNAVSTLNDPELIYYCCSHSAKIPCQEKIETGSRLTNVGVHRKYLSQNPEWQLRLKLSHELGAEGDDVDGAIGGPGANGGDEDGEELNEEIALETQRPALSVIGEDMYSGLPIFTPCGSADLRMYPFARERILTCLRAPKLLNHLLLNLDLIAAIVSWTALLDNRFEVDKLMLRF